MANMAIQECMDRFYNERIEGVVDIDLIIRIMKYELCCCCCC